MPDDSMCFLEPAVSEEGALRTRRLPLTAGVDPLVVVAGPIAAMARERGPAQGPETRLRFLVTVFFFRARWQNLRPILNAPFVAKPKIK